jgi:hypothetical protein
MAAAGLGLAATRLLAGDGLTPPPRPNTGPDSGPGVPSDAAEQFAGIPGADVNTQILNFALTLEILEADLYRQALNLASGKALDAPLDADPGSYSRKVGGGGLKNSARNEGFRYLRDFAYVEAAHRDFLRAALGDAAVSPNPGGYKFPAVPEANIKSILAGILPLEETGVRAYLGALPYFTDLNLAQTAGTIYSTEARHSAVIAYALNIDPGPRLMEGDIRVTAAQPSENTFEYLLEPKTVIQVAGQFFA